MPSPEEMLDQQAHAAINSALDMGGEFAQIRGRVGDVYTGARAAGCAPDVALTIAVEIHTDPVLRDQVPSSGLFMGARRAIELRGLDG